MFYEFVDLYVKDVFSVAFIGCFTSPGIAPGIVNCHYGTTDDFNLGHQGVCQCVYTLGDAYPYSKGYQMQTSRHYTEIAASLNCWSLFFTE